MGLVLLETNNNDCSAPADGGGFVKLFEWEPQQKILLGCRAAVGTPYLDPARILSDHTASSKHNCHGRKRYKPSVCFDIRRVFTMARAVIPPITRLCDGVIRILGMNPGMMELQGTNTYLLGNGKRRILLDTGDENKPEYIQNLKTVLKEEEVDLDHIIITHWHHDHIGGVKEVLKHVNSDVSVWKYPRTDGEEQEGIPLKFLKDGHEFKTGNATFKVCHTPGHTTDHIILFSPTTGQMFSGDNVLGEGTTVFEDLYEYMKSLSLMVDMKPTVIFPGHGPVVEDPVKKLTYYISHRNAREAQVLNVLRESPEKKFSAMDIVKIIYVDVDESLYPAASINVTHHLEKLLKEGKVTSSGDGWQYHKLESSL